jgi:hypothetical protein
MAANVVVIETVSGLIEGEIILALLKSAGIEAELSREAALSPFSLGIGRLARVEVLVREEQAAQARELLEDYHANRLDEGTTETPSSG